MGGYAGRWPDASSLPGVPTGGRSRYRRTSIELSAYRARGRSARTGAGCDLPGRLPVREGSSMRHAVLLFALLNMLSRSVPGPGASTRAGSSGGVASVHGRRGPRAVRRPRRSVLRGEHPRLLCAAPPSILGMCRHSELPQKRAGGADRSVEQGRNDHLPYRGYRQPVSCFHAQTCDGPASRCGRPGPAQ